MRFEIRELVKRLTLTAVYVTHDQEEALVLSDRIAVMRNGNLEQVGSPREIYERPSKDFVAGFVGEANMVEARVEGAVLADGSGLVSSPVGTLTCVLPRHVAIDETVTLMFRPDNLVLCKGLHDDRPNLFSGRIVRVAYIGNRLKCEIQVGSSILLGEFPSSAEIREGEEIKFEIPSNRIRVFVHQGRH